MGFVKNKKTIKPKKRMPTKKEKVAKKASRMQRIIEYRKKLKRARKGKVVPIKKKRQQEAQQEIIDYASKQQFDNTTQSQINILNILGLGQGNGGNEDWQNKLQQKLKEANSKSLDNPEVRRVYGEIGKIFSTYRSGKVPKAFKIIPNLQKWKQVLTITRPENWTPQAMCQAVNIFASNFDPARAQQFYQQYLVPAIKNDLKKNKKLNYHYYESLKKGLYKTNAWFKGILFKFCENNILLRQIKVIESLLSKMSIPVISSSVALIKLTQMEPTTAIIHYLKAFIGKSYNFPKKVIFILNQYFLKFKHIKEELPLIWHQLLLSYCQQYKGCLDEMQMASLAQLVKVHHHKTITPEILKQIS